MPPGTSSRQHTDPSCPAAAVPPRRRPGSTQYQCQYVPMPSLREAVERPRPRTAPAAAALAAPAEPDGDLDEQESAEAASDEEGDDGETGPPAGRSRKVQVHS